MMRLLWSFFLCGLFSITFAQGPQRDGLVQDIGGWYGMSYHAVRWEPLCGTVGPLPENAHAGAYCVEALNVFTNITDRTVAYFDTTGIRYERAGIGLGRAMCLCFAMSDVTGKATDICWYFDSIGQYIPVWWWRQPGGSYRPGAYKSLPRCANTNLQSLHQQWSYTAVMPTYTGAVQTLDSCHCNGGGRDDITRPTLQPRAVDATRDTAVSTVTVVISRSSNEDKLRYVKVGAGLGLGLSAFAAILGIGLYLAVKRMLQRKHLQPYLHIIPSAVTMDSKHSLSTVSLESQASDEK